MYYYLVALVLLFLAYLLFPNTFRSVAQPLLTVWWQGNNLPHLYYQPDSPFCQQMVGLCKMLTQRYTPPLWGYIGHLQTVLFSIFGRFEDTPVKGTRIELHVDDGSTMSYDIYEPLDESNVILFVLPGINNSSESDYVKTLISVATQRNYRVAVLNHMGSLTSIPITGSRIFTYGGVGDALLMYNDLVRRYGDDAKFVGVGYSLGACILLRLFDECEAVQKNFVCGFSFCQGYSPNQASPYLNSWNEARRVYNFIITKRLVHLVRRHKNELFRSNKNKVVAKVEGKMLYSVPSSNLCNDRDMNGFPLNRSATIAHEADQRIWSSNSILQFDECFSRCFTGFNSLTEFYEWNSCEHFMARPSTVPIVLVNSLDDPIIPNVVHEIAVNYALKYNPNAIFVQTLHGGHLGYYEGGYVIPSKISWMERLVFEYVPIAMKLQRK